MPRPLRFVPPNTLVEITTRTIQGRLLLRPSPELNDLVLGVIGKAQSLYTMIIHAFVVTSNHAHFLLSPETAQQLARFMQFVNANIAKEAGRLHDWPERLWSRRYRSIPVVDEQAGHARMRYLLAHGAKEGLVAAASSWPGAHCIEALRHGDRLRGTWIDRSAECRARAAGREITPGQFATTFDIKLTPLSTVEKLSPDEQQAHYRRLVADIDEAAATTNRELGRTPMGTQAILAQNPHHRPAAPDRSPAPLVHAHDEHKRTEYLNAYRLYVIAFRAGVEGLTSMAKRILGLFPDWAFPPGLPYKATTAAPA
jgi:hypothetical protein